MGSFAKLGVDISTAAVFFCGVPDNHMQCSGRTTEGKERGPGAELEIVDFSFIFFLFFFGCAVRDGTLMFVIPIKQHSTTDLDGIAAQRGEAARCTLLLLR